MDAILLEIADIAKPTWLIYMTIAFGLLSCFLGYKLLRIWMSMGGFIIGMSLGYFVSINQVKNVAITILIGFILGLLFGFIAYRVHVLGVFLIAFAMTLAFAGQLLVRYSRYDYIWLALTIILAVVAAGLATKFAKPVIIIATTLNGATAAILGVFSVMNIEGEGKLLLASFSLALLGMLMQFLTNKSVPINGIS